MNVVISMEEFSKLQAAVGALSDRVSMYESRVSLLEASAFGDVIEPLLMREEEKPTAETPAKKKRKASVLYSNLDLLPECSSTELVHILWDLGERGASRQMLREDMIADICALAKAKTNNKQPWESGVEIEDPLHEIRTKTYTFITTQQVDKSNMTCTLKCMTCPHSTVIECWADNSNVITEQE